MKNTSIFSTAMLLLATFFVRQTAHAQLWNQDGSTKSITTNTDFNNATNAMLGVGTTTPSNAKLNVQGAIGNTVASFRRSATGKGVSIVSDMPGVYFNSYFRGLGRSMSTGFAGKINFDPDQGRFDFGLTENASTAANTILTMPSRMSITKDGNVGIGTETPASRLDIAGQDAIRAFGFEPFITLLDNNSYKSARIQAAHGDIAFFKGDPDWMGGFNYTPQMVIKDDGNVDIGGGAGTGKLTVNNLDFYKPTLNMEGNSPYMMFRQSADNGDIAFIRGWAGAVDAFGFGDTKGLEFGTSPGGGRLMFSTEYTRRMNIEANGNVLIGTNFDPIDYKLAVSGKIICEELRVKLRGNWPDYVFATGYRLKPLEEVEAHIKAENHLPGIPAATELEKEGILVGEMQRKMMEKIEELTLYVIEINKENKALKQRVEQLEGKQ